ncbi:hypothetical protein C5C36_02880 [Rathayibacter sp. AY1G1]|jgi:thiamine biosynthesis lipoprotein ApbE|uniref:hypothetical protein n=1 Tax=unclassified Rathayibacter TaxID=2609250 RepID=UPI000CE8170F|nr:MULTISPECIES: hypothetical protein [unclassified Rathayibacter]PPF10572.1 hypothetical protein C5B98_11390 [Rathayibacter sp. AY1A5]PPG19896.1 hypothetical protein C5C74_05325 [Rathayibacter sp. AY1E8]PPG50265.1 hypothetical protein C5C24_10525 [Rathayibacter sp. AY2B3]PPG62301.1 hypothetical protein C5C69_05420 [Rathayibacter sp. AY1C7]PPG90466.1 hypothetical protein C5C39_09945 [Rathayibacter sp. AY1F3]
MTDTRHLHSNQRDTLERLLEDSPSHNVLWADVLTLLEAVGTVHEKHDGAFSVTVGSTTETLHRPHHKDVDEQQLVDLRRLLRGAGYGA